MRFNKKYMRIGENMITLDKNKTVFNDYQKDKIIFIPNEIFDDFSKLKYTTNSHYAFAISYYVLITYFYYTAHYGGKLITQQDIKEILGYNRDNKQIDYIIKKNGLLDKSGYTETTSDYPVAIEHEIFDNTTEFIMIDEYKQFKYRDNESRNYKIKYPIKAFFRTKNDYKDGEETGTFFYFENTTKINADEFFKIINNKELGCVGFLIYLYIKKNKSICLGYDNLSSLLNISSRTLKNKIKILEICEYINVQHVFRSSKNNNSNIYSIKNSVQS
jgi:hypothetical protein